MVSVTQRTHFSFFHLFFFLRWIEAFHAAALVSYRNVVIAALDREAIIVKASISPPGPICLFVLFYFFLFFSSLVSRFVHNFAAEVFFFFVECRCGSSGNTS
jgi:hypothetical protein